MYYTVYVLYYFVIFTKLIAKLNENKTKNFSIHLIKISI